MIVVSASVRIKEVILLLIKSNKGYVLDISDYIKERLPDNVSKIMKKLCMFASSDTQADLIKLLYNYYCLMNRVGYGTIDLCNDYLDNKIGLHHIRYELSNEDLYDLDNVKDKLDELRKYDTSLTADYICKSYLLEDFKDMMNNLKRREPEHNSELVSIFCDKSCLDEDIVKDVLLIEYMF